MALASAAGASVIAASIRISVTAHVPLEIVAAHLTKVIPLLPRFIGPFGFCCWALATLIGWVAVRSGSSRSAVPPRGGAAGRPAITPSDGPIGSAGPGLHVGSRE